MLLRGTDHASDIAILVESHTRVETTGLDFVDAFMAVPLHQLSNRALMQTYMSCRAQAIMRSLCGECSALEERPTLWFTRL